MEPLEKDFPILDAVIEEKELSLMLVGQCRAFENLADYDADFFDEKRHISISRQH